MNYAQVIIDHVLQLLALVASVCLPLVAKAIVDYVNAKTSIHLGAAEEERIGVLLGNALDYAEEQARKHALAEAAKLPSSQKLDHAVDFVFAEARRRGLAQIEQTSASAIHDLLEAKLASVRWREDSPASVLATRTSAPPAT